MSTVDFKLNGNKSLSPSFTANFAAGIERHPCFSKEASKHFGRIHLPVAKTCNISCNYCHRDYDCPNESRPGVTSGLLTPEDAVKRIYEVKSFFNDISVAAVAGPGDSLAEPRDTMKTFELIIREFPEIILCMSTNGLNLADNLAELEDKRVNFITVTLNAIDVSIAAKIYRYVNYKGASYMEKDAAGLLLDRQIKGIEKAVKMGFTIKINSVLIPGVNDFHIKDISEKVKKLGVYLFNVMPMIPAKKSYFYKTGVKGASRKDVVKITKEFEGINIMEHCRQCRSDAAGLLSEDLSKKLGKPEVNTNAGKCGIRL